MRRRTGLDVGFDIMDSKLKHHPGITQHNKVGRRIRRELRGNKRGLSFGRLEVVFYESHNLLHL
jgi:hypothetical protein